MVGKTLRAAKKRLAAAFCRLGNVKKVYAKAKKGHVVAQRPKPGKHLKSLSRVALTVSKGTRK